MDKEKKYGVLEVLETFGRYHWMHYMLAALPSLVVTMVNINYVFVAGDMEYRCRIPECDTTDSTHHPPIWWPNATIDKCSKPIISENYFSENETCSKNMFTGEIGECSEWIYEGNSTIVSAMNLACQPWKINLVGTIHNIGTLFSMIITGWMSDRFGRKLTMIVCATTPFIGQLKQFTTSYYLYVTVEFFEALLSGGIYLATSVMLIEFGSKSKRVFAGVLTSYVVYFGECIFAGIAMFVPYWKDLIRIVYAPPIFFLTYIFIIAESPRWQVLNGKTDEAKRTIEDIAKTNKIPINEQELKDLDDAKLKLAFNIKSYETREGLNDVLRSREILKRLLVASVCRFTCGIVYYGMLINSVLLPGDKYVNFLLSTIMSFPGELIAMYFMNKIGRKMPLMIGYFVCGVLVVASGFAPTTWSKILCFCLGKMVISACLTGIVTYTMEFYPTSTRASLLSVGSVMSRCGALLAPLTPMLLPISPALPFLVFFGMSLLSSVLLTLTPETKDLPLMDTISQVEELARASREAKKRLKINCETIVTKI